MRKLFLPVLVLALPFWVWAEKRTSDPEEKKLTAFFQKFLEAKFKHWPLEATRLGDHRFDHLLDDLSVKSRAAWTEKVRQTLADLPRQVDYRKLSRPAQIDYEIIKHDLMRALWLAENTRPFEEDPRVYSEYITDSIYLILEQSTVPRADKIKSCLARMARIPKVIAAARKNLRHPPYVHLKTAILQNRGAIAFYESGLFELIGETPALSDLRPAARRLVKSLKDYQKFLETDLLLRADGDWRLGKKKFAQKLVLELDAGLSTEQVLREAEKEFERVEHEMYVIARQLWSRTFPKKPLPPEDARGRRATITKVLARLNREHGKVENLVKDVRATVAKIKAFIKDKDILRLPEPDRCKIIEMPEFQRGNSVAFLNQAPALDPKANSVYAVSPPPRDWDARRVNSFMEEYNRHMIQILTIHEAYPGHYVQLEYSNRHPSLIRRVLFSGVFAEGWAVYTEGMMLDQGYGKGDLALRLNQLKWYLRSVANAILDYQMHCRGMTDAEALKFLTRRAYQSEGEALGKIIRAKQSSCQLSTYFVGRTAFHRLRQKVQRERGDQFSLGRFQEEVLSHGTLPVKYLPELVGGKAARRGRKVLSGGR
jgi:uncharacterized protein (DUF885 family)